MKPARHIGRGHDLQHFGIIAHGPGSKAFAHIGIQIHADGHGSGLLFLGLIGGVMMGGNHAANQLIG